MSRSYLGRTRIFLKCVGHLKTEHAGRSPIERIDIVARFIDLGWIINNKSVDCFHAIPKTGRFSYVIKGKSGLLYRFRVVIRRQRRANICLATVRVFIAWCTANTRYSQVELQQFPYSLVANARHEHIKYISTVEKVKEFSLNSINLCWPSFCASIVFHLLSVGLFRQRKYIKELSNISWLQIASSSILLRAIHKGIIPAYYYWVWWSFETLPLSVDASGAQRPETCLLSTDN